MKWALTLTTILGGGLCFAANLKISSSPAGAIISMMRGAEEVKLGQSPLSLDTKSLKGVENLLIFKEGHLPMQLPISDAIVKDSFTINVQLKKMSPQFISQYTETLVKEESERLVDEVFLVQDLLSQKKTEIAISKIQELLVKHPSSYSLRVLQANALLLSGKSRQAYSIYSNLLDTIPKTRSYLRSSLVKICQKLSSRVPASERRDDI